MKTISTLTLSRRADLACAVAFWLSLAIAFWADWRIGISMVCFAASQDPQGAYRGVTALAVGRGFTVVHPGVKKDDQSGDT